jgi:hypothetical protein
VFFGDVRVLRGRVAYFRLTEECGVLEEFEGLDPAQVTSAAVAAMEACLHTGAAVVWEDGGGKSAAYPIGAEAGDLPTPDGNLRSVTPG